MKLSYEWLKEYTNIDVSPDELAKGLTMSGSEVGAIEPFGTDKVMELEITSNRPDCLNIIGLAREVSAVFDKDLYLPETSLEVVGSQEAAAGIECAIKNKVLCPKYTARIIRNIKVFEASEKIRNKISALGLRPVNNIVDITNFCLMENGQPLHAFDLDRIAGGKIIIREAVKGEKIVTIDDVERELEAGMLVIADAERPIAVAGIMGGKGTEVTAATKNILLESAYFDPISIRHTARILGISSDSSYRFERGVDKGGIVAASDRAAGIICKEASGKLGAFYDEGVLAGDNVSIEFSIENAGRVLGITLETEEVKRILSRLGMMVSKEHDAVLTVEVPTFREDLREDVDLIEEVARIHGYDKVPAEVTKFIPDITRKEHSRLVTEKLREIFPALGLNEIMTYSLISDQALERFIPITAHPVELKNPLSAEQKILTPQLLDGMLRTIAWNINRGNKDLGLFEIGKIYAQPGKKGKVRETPVFCLGLTGAFMKNWQTGRMLVDLYDIKGTVETVLRRLKVAAVFYEAEKKGIINFTEIRLPGETVSAGFLGEVTTNILDEYDIAQPVYICQVKLDRVIESADLRNRYHAIPRFPFSIRDISILCDKTLASGMISEIILANADETVRGIEVKDVYEGKQIPEDKKSITYSIKYGLDDRTLTDDEIESAHTGIKEALTKKLNVTFR